MENISSIGSLLSKLKSIVRVRLLPYHQARSKYEMIGRTDKMHAFAVPTQAQMDAIASCLRDFQLSVQ